MRRVHPQFCQKCTRAVHYFEILDQWNWFTSKKTETDISAKKKTRLIFYLYLYLFNSPCRCLTKRGPFPKKHRHDNCSFRWQGILRNWARSTRSGRSGRVLCDPSPSKLKENQENLRGIWEKGQTVIGNSLVVVFGFLPQNFEKVVGTLECHLLFCECIWGGGSTSTPHDVIKLVWTFCTQRWWGHMEN